MATALTFVEIDEDKFLGVPVLAVKHRPNVVLRWREGGGNCVNMEVDW